MKHLLTVLFLVLCIHALVSAQVAPQFPPVPGNDIVRDNYGLWANTGWVLDTDGELRPDVQFVSEGAFPRTYIRRDATISWVLTTLDTASGGQDSLRRLDMALVGETSTQPDAIASSAKIQEKHFYLPHCGTTGVTHVAGYNRIVYPDIYPHIDLWVFSGALGQKVMFVVWPGGDPDDIVLDFTGQNELFEDLDGWLKILLADKWISLPQPVAYQFDQNNTIQPLLWTADYTPIGNNGIVTMEYDAYDPTKPLVLLIGPQAMGGGSYEETGLCWSTYVGDNGTESALDLRSDKDNNVYMAGWTSSTLIQFPADPGLNLAQSGNNVAFMTRFDATHDLNWTVFYGGQVGTSAAEGHAIAIQEAPMKRIFLAGHTNANSLWTLPNPPAYFDNANNNSTSKGFILELTEGGLAIWATYFGEHDVRIMGMDMNADNVLAITGVALNDLPEVQYGPPTGSLDQPYAGGTDAFVALFDATRQLYLCNWFGGSATDAGFTVRINQDKVIVAGITDSGDIDMLDSGGGAYTQAYGGMRDCFVLEMDLNGVEAWSTYVGGSNNDQLGHKGLHINADGDVLICGKASDDLEIFPGPNWYDDVPNGGNGFIARYSGADRSPLWTTFCGSHTGAAHVLMSIVQGLDGVISVGGYTTGPDLPLLVPPGTYGQAGAFETQQTACLIQFNNDQTLRHSTWFGGDNGTTLTWFRALAANEHGVFAAGVTAKAGNPLAYFPLDDGQGLAWFDGDYNHLAETGGLNDAFLTLFCDELATSIGGNFGTVGTDLLISSTDNTLIVFGLKDGRYPLVISDPSGKLVMSGTTVSQSRQSSAIGIGQLAAGLYIVQIDGVGSIKFSK